MQFLDAIGLVFFWEKIKNWVTVNYLSLTGGNVFGDINISGNVTALKFKKINGTSTQVLIADGSVKGINSANGIAGLDANGRIPLAQLGNLDTSLFKLVTSLPSSGESNKIYIVKDGSDANDVYQEYYYTNGAWEKIGTHTVKVDLTPYAKKTEAVINMDFRGVASDGTSTSNTTIRNLVYTLGDGRQKVADVPLAEPSTTGARPYVGQNGFMRASDKAKLDGIAPNANNYSLPLAANGTRGGIQVGYEANGRNYPVQLSGEKAYVNVPWTDTNTTYDLSPYAKTADVNTALSKKVDVVSGKGLSTEDFTTALKTKLNGIATGATADSAITTGEIDALFS